MARKNSNSTPTFVLSLTLKTEPFQVSILEKHFEIGRQLYNVILRELLKRYDQMKRTKKHQKLKRSLRSVKQQLVQYEQATSNSGKKQRTFFLNENSMLLSQLTEMELEYGLFEYSTHEWVKEPRNHYTHTSKNKVQFHSALAQSVASRAWNAFEKLLKGKARKVHFKRRGELHSLEGKQSHTGIIFDKETRVCTFANLKIPVIVKKGDHYAIEALQNRIKYGRITKETIRGKVRYFLQLALEGIAPQKRNKKTGQFKYPIGKSRVGIDLGTQSIAVVSNEKVLLSDLAPQIQPLHQEIRKIQRKMERSKRTTNPQNFNENGTIKKGKKVWTFSHRYINMKTKLKELHRHQRVKRLESHGQTANQLLSWGDNYFIEQMNMQALKKRVKETEQDENGRFKRKKRFGKSIANKAPASFKNSLKEKVLRYGGSFQEVNTRTFKASQYDHIKDECTKKKLSERWHIFENGTKVQRDLYSAFLLMNSEEDLKTTNRALCLETFEGFWIQHENEMSRIKKSGIRVKNSGIF